MNNFEKIKAMSIDEMAEWRGRMTTELEQEFFKVFGIEQKCKSTKFDNNDQKCEECIADYIIGCSCDEKYYPKITDHKLLEMICILNDYEGINVEGTL